MNHLTSLIPGYAEYPEPGKGAAIECVVSHPDAGGPCGEPAVLEVWSLPFCERHGAEATLAALQEVTEGVGHELDLLTEAENQRHLPNHALIHALARADCYPDYDQDHQKVQRAVYPPIEGRADPDTLAFDYDKPQDGPYDWWTEIRWLLCKFMRQAHERGHIQLVHMLEPLRERASAQVAHAEDDQDRRWRKRPWSLQYEPSLEPYKRLFGNRDEKLLSLIRRGDDLNDAYTVILNAPDKELTEGHRRQILDTLARERDEGWAEANSYKEELCLKRPETTEADSS